MFLKNQPNEFSTVSRYTHYIAGLAIILVLAAGFALSNRIIPNGPTRLWTISLHKLVGFGVLWVAILWWVNYLRQSSPAYPQGFAPVLKFAASTAKLVLLACAVIMPLSGWLMGVAAGKTMIPAMGFNLPAPFALKPEMAGTLWQVHETTAYILLATLCAHVAGALYHGLIRKDDILQRMFPFIKRRNS